jgi:hypothetical protein
MWRTGCESVPVSDRRFLDLVIEPYNIIEINPAVAIEIHNPCRLVCTNPVHLVEEQDNVVKIKGLWENPDQINPRLSWFDAGTTGLTDITGWLKGLKRRNGL